jgi:hypothetical protein
MTYHFDPERSYEKEYATFKAQHKKGELTDIEIQKEEMLSRLDGTYLLAK